MRQFAWDLNRATAWHYDTVWFCVYSSSLLSLCAHQKNLTSLQAIAAKRFIQMLCAAYADLTGQPLSFAAKSGSAFVTAPAHTVAT